MCFRASSEALLASPHDFFTLPPYAEGLAMALAEAPSPPLVWKRRTYNREVQKYIDIQAEEDNNFSTSSTEGGCDSNVST